MWVFRKVQFPEIFQDQAGLWGCCRHRTWEDWPKSPVVWDQSLNSCSIQFASLTLRGVMFVLSQLCWAWERRWSDLAPVERDGDTRYSRSGQPWWHEQSTGATHEVFWFALNLKQIKGNSWRTKGGKKHEKATCLLMNSQENVGCKSWLEPLNVSRRGTSMVWNHTQIKCLSADSCVQQSKITTGTLSTIQHHVSPWKKTPHTVSPMTACPLACIWWFVQHDLLSGMIESYWLFLQSECLWNIRFPYEDSLLFWECHRPRMFVTNRGILKRVPCFWNEALFQALSGQP